MTYDIYSRFFLLLNPITKLWSYIVKQYTKAYNVYQFVKVMHLKNIIWSSYQMSIFYKICEINRKL